ncbi:MAG: SAM-dependent methyltransferase [Oscillospiraceae bacterium]
MQRFRASTGASPTCLLQHGAAKVFAIDVGYGQLAWSIRSDPRVVTMERTNIRYGQAGGLGQPLDLSVVDVSFISLRIVLPAIRALLKPSGQVLCLIKPQFEAGKEKVGKKGVVRDPEVHRQVLDGFVELARQLEFAILGLTFSPVKGPEGNIEFLAHLTRESREGICPGYRRHCGRRPWRVGRLIRLKKIVLTPNPYRDKSFKFVLTAQSYLASAGMETGICLPFDVDRGLDLPRGVVFSNLEQELPGADMLVCFGGDGTILHASKAATRSNVPVLGVNIGTVGFIAELESTELQLLRRIAAGEYEIERRKMLDGHGHPG